jgi:hypothetical protein
VNREQLKKQPNPIDITEFGIVSVVNEEQLKNNNFQEILQNLEL